jgi:glutamyl-tRNA reductase
MATCEAGDAVVFQQGNGDMIGLLGLDYQGAPSEVRGWLTFEGARLAEALRALKARPALREVAILSTCNRTEVYYTTASDEDGEVPASVREWVLVAARQAAHVPAARAGGPRSASAERQLLDALYEHAGDAAADHLLRVAAGLRSQVVGEAQILGQVRDALAAAEAAGSIADELRALFTAAIKTGKRARAETALGRADISLATLAIQTADELLGGLRGVSALVIGAGRMSRLCAHLLRQQGVGALILANRTPALAADLAREVGARTVALDQVGDHLAGTDLIVCATAAPYPVLTEDLIAPARAPAARPLVILDLAVPPDVEVGVGGLPNVTLVTLDALRDHSVAAVDGDMAHVLAEVDAIVLHGLRAYQRARTLRLAVPGIAALRRHVDRSEQAELARALGELAELSDAEHAAVERFGRRLVDKMFHHLVARIRSLAEYDEVPPAVTMRVLARLFADPDAPPDA